MTEGTCSVRKQPQDVGRDTASEVEGDTTDYADSETTNDDKKDEYLNLKLRGKLRAEDKKIEKEKATTKVAKERREKSGPRNAERCKSPGRLSVTEESRLSIST